MRATALGIKPALRHPVALGAVLAGSGVAFTAAPGAIGDAMTIGGGLFALNLLFGNYHFRELTTGHWAVLGIVSALVLISVSLPGSRVHDRSLRYLLLTPGMVLACHALSKQLADVHRERMTAGIAALLCTCVTLQLIGFELQRSGGGFGFYDNPHHLGLFASLALPLAGYVMLRTGGWRRLVPIPWMVAALYLLWQSGSRISWIVLFTSVPLAALLFLKPRQFALVLLGACLLAALSGWLSGYPAIEARMADLWDNIQSEERMLIWPATLEVLAHNTPTEWLFGHGIGSFRFDFGEHFADSEQLRIYPFPHNAVLQLLFENGLAGLFLVVGGFGRLMWSLWRIPRRNSGSGERHLAMTLFALLCVEAGHCLLTKSIYSRYILCSLSLIIGASLVAIDESGVRPAGATRTQEREGEPTLSG